MFTEPEGMAASQDDRKIAFVIHVTNEAYGRECLAWLDRLEIPDGYSTEVLTVADVADMATAYEEARQASNAKVKIYLEDKTFVINSLLVQDLLTIFESDISIGAVGVWGVQADSDEGLGKIILQDSQGTYLLSAEKAVDVSGEIYDIAAFLGEGLFATRSDLIWESQKSIREQSLYYQEHGYKVAVARQRSAWCLLDREQEKDALTCLKEIVKREGGRGRVSSLIGQEDVYAWYLRAKFQLRRMEYHFPQEDIGELLDALQGGQVSIEAIEVIGAGNLLYKKRVMNYLDGLQRMPQVCEADGNRSMTGDRVLHVASSLNRKYVRYVCVMLESLCRWNADVEIHAWLLHEELEESDKRLIQRTLAGRRITVDFLYVDKSNFAKCMTTDMWSVEAYFRLQMMDLLPARVDRLLYLDVDTLVLKPIYDLYFADFEGMDIIGCRDLGSGILFGDLRDEIFADYQGRNDFAYCNSGVMLWNVAKLRGKVSFQDYLKVMEEKEYRLIATDQDVINLVHAGKIKLVDAGRYDFFARPMFSRVDCEEMKSHVSILHYSGPKPWDGRQKREEVDALWWEVARDMPFYTSLLEDMLRDSFQEDLAGQEKM